MVLFGPWNENLRFESVLGVSEYAFSSSYFFKDKYLKWKVGFGCVFENNTYETNVSFSPFVYFSWGGGGKKSSPQVTLRLKLVWVKVGMSLYLYSRRKCISVCFRNEFTSQGTSGLGTNRPWSSCQDWASGEVSRLARKKWTGHWSQAEATLLCSRERLRRGSGERECRISQGFSTRGKKTGKRSKKCYRGEKNPKSKPYDNAYFFFPLSCCFTLSWR